MSGNLCSARVLEFGMPSVKRPRWGDEDVSYSRADTWRVQSASFPTGKLEILARYEPRRLMRENFEQPDALTMSRAYLRQNNQRTAGKALDIGAAVRTARWRICLVSERYPLPPAICSAHPANRIWDTGALMQRTRCYYFYDRSFPCQ